jgi:hypothetical protein
MRSGARTGNNRANTASKIPGHRVRSLSRPGLRRGMRDREVRESRGLHRPRQSAPSDCGEFPHCWTIGPQARTHCAERAPRPRPTSPAIRERFQLSGAMFHAGLPGDHAAHHDQRFRSARRDHVLRIFDQFPFMSLTDDQGIGAAPGPARHQVTFTCSASPISVSAANS